MTWGGDMTWALDFLNIPHNANGSNDWRGGLTYVHEQGGELINLPQHTQIIPHDLSMAYVQELARQRASVTNNNYGVRQQVTNLNIGNQTVAKVITPSVSTNMSNTQYSRGRAGNVRR
jgi:phage-related protein